MGKYGYGLGYGYGKKVWTSTSGWESSHFGGFTRIIYDYPYIKFDFKADIDISKDLRTNLGIYSAEKLIKMYLVKCKELGHIQHFKKEVVTEKDFLGREKRYEVLSLDHESILNDVM